MTLNNKEVLAVKVPDDAYDFSFRRHNQIVYLLKDNINPLTGWVNSEVTVIPNTRWREFKQEDWQLLGRANEITEEQATEVFGIIPFNGKFLEHLPHGMMRAASFSAAFVLDTALESFQSWCRKEEITNEVLIIKK